MPNDEPDGDEFIILFPVFTVADGPAFQVARASNPRAHPGPFIITLGSPDIGNFFALFTDNDLAWRALAELNKASGNNGKQPLAIGSPEGLLELLPMFEKRRINNVGIDITIAGGKITGRFQPIRHVIDRLSAGR